MGAFFYPPPQAPENARKPLVSNSLPLPPRGPCTRPAVFSITFMGVTYEYTVIAIINLRLGGIKVPDGNPQRPKKYDFEGKCFRGRRRFFKRVPRRK